MDFEQAGYSIHRGYFSKLFDNSNADFCPLPMIATCHNLWDILQ